jgi:hypothetical protein
MPIQYPSFLPPPLQSGYSSQVSPAFNESAPAVGGIYSMKVTDDIYATYRLSFSFTDGQASLFWQWFKQETVYGSRPFNMLLKVNGEMIEQECRFTRSGIPQLSSETGTQQTYSAEVITRSITTSFDTSYASLKWFAERSPDGDPFTGTRILDTAMTDTAPEA